jgi:hypothetical protein
MRKSPGAGVESLATVPPDQPARARTSKTVHAFAT